ncbi:hypothetical protein [Neomoorella thermoacetica]|uniref:hypothetical protein n=1 Tax=Neomoorella thermoacetica TaxID=1525 RepID=UPI0011E75B20|nr:hypothetical protein [Moorella thermoacetica]
MSRLARMISDTRGSIVKDLEPNVGWQGEFGHMSHVERFNSHGDPANCRNFSCGWPCLTVRPVAGNGCR